MENPNPNPNPQLTQKNSNESDEKKSVATIVRELKYAIAQVAIITEVENESGIRKLNTLRRQLIEAIDDDKMVDALTLKMIYQKCFNLPTDTPEMMQLHDMVLDIDKRFAEVKANRKADQMKTDQSLKFLKWAVVSLAIGSGLLNVASWEIVQQILRGFGLGF